MLVDVKEFLEFLKYSGLVIGAITLWIKVFDKLWGWIIP